MKKIVLGGACALAFVAAAGSANAQFTTGFVGIEKSDIEGIDYWGLNGTAAFEVGSNFETQVDAGVAKIDGGVDATIWDLTGHGFYESGAFKGGVFLGYQDYDGADLTAYGLEGRYALTENISLGTAFGIGEIGAGAIDFDVEAWRVDASVFFNDRTRFDVSYTDLGLDVPVPPGLRPPSSIRFDTRTYGIGLEHQLEAAPYSLLFNFESANSDIVDSEAWTIGVRRIFGGNLKDRDRSSSPFANIQSNFGGRSTLLQGLILPALADLLEEEWEQGEGEDGDYND